MGERMNEWMKFNDIWNLVHIYLITVPPCDSIDETLKSHTNSHVGRSELILSATSVSNGNNNVQKYFSTWRIYVRLRNILLTFQTHFSLHNVNRRYTENNHKRGKAEGRPERGVEDERKERGGKEGKKEWAPFEVRIQFKLVLGAWNILRNLCQDSYFHCSHVW